MQMPTESPACERQGFFFGISLKEEIVSFFVFFLLAVLFFLPLLNPENTLRGPDLTIFFIPFRQMWVEIVQQGYFPLWEPFTSSGNPLFATLQGAILYPFSIFFLFLEFFQAFNLILILHYALAGFFMYWLLRATRCSKMGSSIGALVFMFGGYLFSLRFYLSTLFPVVWSPLLILCFFGGWIRNDRRLAIISSFIAALMMVSGGAETCYQLFAWLILFSLFPFMIFQESTIPQLNDRLIYLGLFLLFFAGFSAIQMLPTLELLENSLRSKKFTMEYASKWSLHLRDLLSFILLDPYGYIAFPRAPEEGQAWMQSQYVGVLPLTLAGVFFFKGGKRAWTFFFIIAVSCSLALGMGSSLYELFFDYLPWFGKFRYPIKFILPLVLILSITSAWGWDRLHTIPSTAIKKGILLGLSTVCMMGFGVIDFHFPDLLQWMKDSGFFRPNFNNPEINLGNIERLLGFASLFFLFLYLRMKNPLKKMSWGICAFFIIFLDIFFSNHGNYEIVQVKYQKEIPPVTGFLMNNGKFSRVYVEHQSESVKEGEPRKRSYRGEKIYGTRFPVEFRNLNRVQQLGGWNVIAKKFLVTFRRNFYLLHTNSYLNILRMANVKYIVHGGEEPLDGLPLAFEEPPEYRKKLMKSFEFPHPLLRVYENPGYLDRAFLAGNCFAIPDGPQLKNSLLNPKWDPEKWVFLPESPVDLPCLSANEKIEKGNGSVQITYWNSEGNDHNLAPGEYRMQVDSARKQFLVVSDSFYPGWEATVDGEPVKIYRANQAFRAIVMPAGKHEVEFRYRPKSFRYGAWISGTSLFAGIAFVVGSTIRKRKMEEGQEEAG